MSKQKTVNRRFVGVSQSEVVKTDKQKSYNKFQYFIAWLFRMKLAEQYLYMFRISYKGTLRLKANDIVHNEDGELFIVLREENRLAMIVSKDASEHKPFVKGRLFLVTNIHATSNKSNLKKV